MLLTHGHYDHFGGMVGFLAAHRKASSSPACRSILGGEECFCTRETGPANAPSNFGALDRKAIADAGVRDPFAEQPSLVADHGFTTGFIPLVSFEKPAQPSRMKVGLQPDGIGCAPEGLPAGEAQPHPRAGRLPARAGHLLHRQGQGARGPDVVRTPRHRQLGARRDEGIGHQQGARDPRRLPPDADAAGLRAQHRRRAEGDQPRLPHPDALHGHDLLRGREAGDARAGAAQLDGDAFHLWCMTAVRRGHSFGWPL